MSETQASANGGPVAGRPLVLVAITTLAILFGVVALTLAAWGWTYEPEVTQDPPLMRGIDIAVRTVKVLLLSDIYYEPIEGPLKWPLELARSLGTASSLLFGVRLLLYAVGSQMHALWFRAQSSDHDVIIGGGPAAVEYARNFQTLFGKSRAIRLAEERAPTMKRLATYARRGSIDNQIRAAVGKRARRVVIDEGDDADTWQIAQAFARACPKAEVLAHITDPWMRDRLSREEGRPGLAAFSYAGGAARQIMLAHPPFLLARKFGAAVQHILIVGFGQVGQSLAREFISTSLIDSDVKMMVTVVDPDAARIEPEFRGRYEGLAGVVDFNFIAGDFRLSSVELMGKIQQRNGLALICAVYVAIDQDSRPLGLAMALREMAAQKGLFGAPIFLCAQHGAGLPTVRQGAGFIERAPADLIKLERRATAENKLCNLRIVSFGSWPDAFDGAGLLEPKFDAQARRFHEQYGKLLAQHAREREPGNEPPPVTPWDILEDQLRVSNRRVASHMRAKASVAGFDLGSWLESEGGCWKTHDLPPAAEYFHIDEPEFMGRMARFEHTRWMLDRYLDGWQYGERRDNHARIRPELVPFDQLDPANVHKDDEVIRTTQTLFDGVKARGNRRS